MWHRLLYSGSDLTVIHEAWEHGHTHPDALHNVAQCQAMSTTERQPPGNGHNIHPPQGMWVLFDSFLHVLLFSRLDLYHIETCVVLANLQWNICKNRIENRIFCDLVMIYYKVHVQVRYLGSEYA